MILRVEGRLRDAPFKLPLFGFQFFHALLNPRLRVNQRLAGIQAVQTLSRLNRAGRLDAPPADLPAMLSFALDLAGRTGGAFDPTVQPLWPAWAGAAARGEQPDPQALEQEQLELVLQVNGKLRGHITVPSSATRESIEALARAHEAVQRHSEGRPVKKTIVVPGKLVNVVV